MAQPIEKWIDELDTEIREINEQLRQRAMQLQAEDPTFNGLIKMLTEKQGAMKYLTEQQPKEEPAQKKPKKKKDKK